MKSIKSVLKASGLAIVIATVILGLLVFSPLWVPWVVVVGLRERLGLRRFLRRHAGQSFLIWRSRHNWHDFIRNNVLAVLPADVQPLHDRRPRPTAVRMILHAKLDWQSEKRGSPLLAFVKQRNVQITSLNDDFQPLKHQARRAPLVQDRVARIIRDALGSGSAKT